MSEGGDYGRREALFAAARPVVSEEQERETARQGRRKTRLRRWFSTLSTLVALGLFVALVWYAYNWGTGGIEQEQLPIIRASAEPEKEAPSDRGGMTVPYQDAMVLNGGGQEQVERIVPPPEEPLKLEGLPEPAAPPTPEPESAETAPAGQAPAEAGEDAIGQMIQMAERHDVTNDAPGGEKADVTVAVPEAKPQPEAPAAPNPAEVQTAQVGQVSGFKVQLASLQDPAGADREWKRLQGLYPDLLGNLSMQTQKAEIEGRGTYYRIQAGPLPSRETADDLCSLLKGRDQPCIVVAP